MHQHFDGFDNEQWDEFKWEAHLNEVERKSEQLRKFITSDPKGNMPRWFTLLQESKSEDDAFEAYIEEELLMDEAYFPEDEDDWEDDDEDWDDDDFLFGISDADFNDINDSEEYDDFDAGDEWKSLSEDYLYSDYSDLESLTIFMDAKFLGVDFLRLAESIHPKKQTKEFQDLVDEVLKIGAKIAGGHSFGFEKDYIGANIAYSKKALICANHAMDLLQDLKKKGLFSKKLYQDLHSRLFELRNDAGIYIQELRDQFRFGME